MGRKYDECHADHKSLLNRIAEWDAENWEIACRQMQINLMQGNVLRARQTLNAYCRDRIPGFLTLDRLISEVLPPKWCDALWDAGFRTMRSLTKATDEELLLIENIGERTVEKIRAICDAIAKRRIPEVGLFDTVDVGDEFLRGQTKQELEKELEFIRWKAQLIEDRLAEMAAVKKPKQRLRAKK
jgi:hypothetical protein